MDDVRRDHVRNLYRELSSIGERANRRIAIFLERNQPGDTNAIPPKISDSDLADANPAPGANKASAPNAQGASSWGQSWGPSSPRSAPNVPPQSNSTRSSPSQPRSVSARSARISFFVLVGFVLLLFGVVQLDQQSKPKLDQLSKPNMQEVPAIATRANTPTPVPTIKIVAPKPQLPTPPPPVAPLQTPQIEPAQTTVVAPPQTPAAVPPQTLELVRQQPVEPKVVPVAKPTPNAKPMSASVVIRTAKEKSPVASFVIVTPTGLNDYVIKLVDVRDEKETMLIYVKSGAKFETKVPLGSYRINGAYGPAWFGEKDLFGDNGSYFKFAKSDGNDVLEFKRSGNSVRGHIISFVGQIDGNARSQSIPRDKF